MEIKKILISQLVNNNGQIEGLPTNPRTIDKNKFNKLTKSIQENPEMLSIRELIVYPHNKEYIVIAGNMRLKAMIALEYSHAICKILPESTTIDQLKAYTVKDNSSFGDWNFELLANEWDVDKLLNWGVDLPINFNLDDGIIEDMEVKIKDPTKFILTIQTDLKSNFEMIKKELNKLKIDYIEREV